MTKRLPCCAYAHRVNIQLTYLHAASLTSKMHSELLSRVRIRLRIHRLYRSKAQRGSFFDNDRAILIRHRWRYCVAVTCARRVATRTIRVVPGVSV